MVTVDAEVASGLDFVVCDDVPCSFFEPYPLAENVNDRRTDRHLNQRKEALGLYFQFEYAYCTGIEPPLS